MKLLLGVAPGRLDRTAILFSTLEAKQLVQRRRYFVLQLGSPLLPA